MDWGWQELQIKHLNGDTEYVYCARFGITGIGCQCISKETGMEFLIHPKNFERITAIRQVTEEEVTECQKKASG